MIPEAQEYYNIAAWQKNKVEYNRISKFNSNKRRSDSAWTNLDFVIWDNNIGTAKKTRCVRVTGHVQ